MSSIMGSHFPAVSAHGPRAGTINAYVDALETGAEYVEFDIRRTADGELAAFHDARPPGRRSVRYQLRPAVRRGRLNSINGALMLFPRHRWSIDAVTGGQAG
jgi:glycerophosphoryl diester phosphodiesterase